MRNEKEEKIGSNKQRRRTKEEKRASVGAGDMKEEEKGKREN